MPNAIKSLCDGCKMNCTAYSKAEYALKKNLKYIYLNNGKKIMYSCSKYSGDAIQEIVSRPVGIPAISHNQNPHNSLNFSNNLNLLNFRTSVVK